MNLKMTDVHEIHERARTKPESFRSVKFNLMVLSPNECPPLLSLHAFTLRCKACLPHFVRFVFFVDDGLKGAL